MQEKSSDPHPLGNPEYDWITLIQNKSQALMAYDQYIKDAEQANSPECAAFFRKVHDADKAQIEEARRHLLAVMQGKMGAAFGRASMLRDGRRPRLRRPPTRLVGGR